jgi:hypothetical protein
MALIQIQNDGTFEAAHEAVAATPAENRTVLKNVKADLVTLRQIGQARERLESARAKVKTAKTPVAKESARKNVEMLKDKVKALGTKRHFPRLSVEALHKKVAAVLHAMGKTPVKPSNKIIKTPQFRESGTYGAPPARAARVPRAIDPASKFDREAKRTAGAVSRGIRTQLRDHAKTAMVPVSNRPGTVAPRAVPSSKKADTATKHTTQPSRGAIGNTLAEIKKIKASIATGTLKGAKLVRAREDLEKQRAALRELRAGKTTKNQAHVVKPGTAKHMGGAKKVAGKTSGMGDASKTAQSGTVASLTEKVARLRERIKTSVNAGQKATMKRLLAQAKEQLAAMKKAR